MSGHDGYRRPFATGTVIEGWGPVFDGECFLMGALTRDGLRLSRPEARNRLVAEVLVQLTATPMGRVLLTGEPTLRQVGSRPGYASLGIASLVYPARAVHEHLARRLACQILETWSGDTSNPPDMTQAVAFLTDNGFDPGSIHEQVLPPELLLEAGIGYPVTVDRSWGQLDTLRDAIDDIVACRLEALNAHRDDLDETAEALAGELGERVRSDLARRIDEPRPAGLQHVLALVRMLKERLFALERYESENAHQQWRTFQALSNDIDRMGRRLAEDGARAATYRPATLPGVLALVLNPHRWLEIWRLWRAVQRTKMIYMAQLERQTQLTVDILQSDLTIHYLREAAARVGDWERRLADLLDVVEGAVGELGGGEGETGRGGDREIGGQGDAGFELEYSVVSPQQVGALYEEGVGDLAEELAAFAEMQGPLSAWMEQTPALSQVSAAAQAFSRNRLRSVLDVTVGQLLVVRYPHADRQQEVIEGLLEAAVPFLGWDETAMRSGDGEAVSQTTVLGMPAADFELVEAAVEPLRRAVSLVPTDDPHRLVALSLVRGIPLAALPIVHEASACYRQTSQPALLHGDPDDVDLPDLLVKGVFSMPALSPAVS